MIASLEAQPEDDEHVQSILKTLRYKRENLLGNPHMTESLLRHRKQFRMITKKNGNPPPRQAVKPRLSKGSDLDDMAVAALSTLSGSSSPERQPQTGQPAPSYVPGTNAVGAAVPYGAYARPPLAAPSHYTPSVTSPYAQPEGATHLSQTQVNAQVHAMYTLNHHQMHMQQAQVQQSYQPRYRLMEQQVPQTTSYSLAPARTSAPEATQPAAYAPSWHLATAPKAQHQQLPGHHQLPQLPQAQQFPQAQQLPQAQACSAALKLPELHLQAPAKTVPAAGSKLPPIEPNAMSLKHLLAY